MENIRNKLYEIQRELINELPQEGSLEREVLDLIDEALDRIDGK